MACNDQNKSDWCLPSEDNVLLKSDYEPRPPKRETTIDIETALHEKRPHRSPYQVGGQDEGKITWMTL